MRVASEVIFHDIFICAAAAAVFGNGNVMIFARALSFSG